MRSLSAFSLRRPALALVLFLALTLALTVVGGSRDHVQPANLKVDGTESARAQALIAGRFDEASTVPILLSGPSKQVRSQGLALSKRLADVPGVTVASPWNAPSLRKVLRPADDQLLMIASITGTKQEIQSRALQLRTTTEARTTGAVEAHVTGVPLLTEALTSASGKAVHRVDLIAIPVLLIVLLLVFRSPLAAALPVLLGGATILAATGGVRLLSTELPVDGLGTALASMMGLALAVDYSLLMVSRFREERRRGLDVREAAAGAVVGTRHTVMTAGASILLAMVLVAVLGPGSPVVSAALGVGVAAIVAVRGAALAMPAALLLTGRWIATAAVAGEADHVAPGRRGSAGRPARAAAPGVWERVGTAAMRRPAATVGAGCVALALLAIPLLSLQTSAPDSGQLPPGSAARADVDAVTRAVGAGWGTSFELVAVADRGTMTTTSRLRALSALQTELAKDPDVRAVVGPGTISKTAAKLRRDGRRLLRQQKALAESLPAQSAKLSELKGSVGELEGGVGGLNGAFSDADSATKTLSTGSSSLEAGVSRLREGVAGASAGVKKLVTKVGGALVGVGRLEEGAGQARAGSAQIASAIHELGGKIAQVRPAVAGFSTRFTEQRDGVARAAAQERTENAAVLEQIKIAQQALTGVRANNSAVRVAKALEAVKAQVKASQVAAQLDAVAGGLNEQIVATNALASRLGAVSIRPLAQRARELTRGLAQLQAGLRGLSSSVSDLSGGSAGFQAALSRLDGGAGRLGSGVEQLKAGVSGVAKSVDASRERSDGLVRGLTGAKTALDSVSTGSAATTKRTDGPSATAKAIDSGYFVLAALDGQGSATGLNVERGGQAARVVVVPRTGPSDPRTKALYERLTERAERFAESTEAQAAIGGPAAQLIDYEQAADHRFPIIVLVLALATTLLLAVLLRSLVVPVIGVALTLLTVAATLGAMSMLFGGGLDATTVIAVFAVMFALSIDYQVFILGRIREEFDRRRDAEAAITAGLASTAHVVTGAGVSMLAVFLAFATADVPGLRQFGLGLAIAVALDATVVRLVVLPAALKLAGRFAWGDPPAERRTEAGRASDGDRGDGAGGGERPEDRRRTGEPDLRRRAGERRAGAGRRADEGYETPRTRPAMGSAD